MTATHPTRIQRRRAKDWRMPASALFVGRGTRWGNPFAVRHVTTRTGRQRTEQWIVVDTGRRVPGFHAPTFGNRLDAQAYAVEAFRSHTRPGGVYAYSRDELVALRDALVDRVPCCWCGVDDPCHVTVLVDLAATVVEG